MLEAINLGISIVIALLVYAFSKRRVSAIAAHTLLCLVFVFSIDGYLSGWQLPTGPELLNTILIVGLLALMVGVLKQ